jgi:hypothetical protein
MAFGTGELLSRLRDDIKETTPGVWSDAELIRALNRAYAIVVAEECRLCESWLEKSALIDIVAAQKAYNVPADALKVGQLEILYDAAAGLYVPMRYIHMGERWMYQQISLGEPLANAMRWTLTAGQIWLVPTPTTNLTSGLRLFYVPKAGMLHYGTATAGSVAGITLASDASVGDDSYNDQYIYIVSGTGVGQRAQITDYVGSTRVASAVFAVAPGAGSVYSIYPKTQESFDECIIAKAGELAYIGVDEGKHMAFKAYYAQQLDAITKAMEVRRRGPESVRFIDPHAELGL